ncbi:MAG: response regulator [Acidobacteriota bacterium]
MKILIVDDKEDNLYLLETLLKGSGYQVISAANGAEALEKLRAEDLDMIIADILMPVMDGFQLCRTVKEDDDLKHIPFVFYTATYKDEKDEEFALKLGAEKYIRKPVEPDEFIQLIQEVIRDVEKGKIKTKKSTIEEEHNLFKLYSKRLVNKLEDKMLNLEREITERKRAENILRVSHHFLEIAYWHTDMTPLLKEFVAEIQNLTDCAAVGIRILDDEGNIPYQAYEGFNKRFYQLESPLSLRSDHCMCINVIKGTANPRLPFYSGGGSFYMNGTTRFLATVSEEEKGQTRNMCNEFGYESVALVPIRFGDGILGLIHIADPRENMVPLDMVELLEGIARQLGTAIQKVRAEEELRSSREQLRNLSAHLQSVREEERKSIARVIHDECSQELTALKMDISWLGNKLHKDQKSLLEKTKTMEKLVDMTIHKAQGLSAELRPGVLDDLGLVAAIEWQLEEFQNRTGIKGKFALDPEDFILDQERSTTIFRILQETLTNVVRHAQATRVKVSLKKKAGQLELQVRDNGRGITEEQISDPEAFGLIGMRERAYYWGGKVEISGVKDKGTIVTASIPLNKQG